MLSPKKGFVRASLKGFVRASLKGFVRASLRAVRSQDTNVTHSRRAHECVTFGVHTAVNVPRT